MAAIIPVSGFLIPLVNTPQTFGINLAGVDYTMTVRWNDQSQNWLMGLSDTNSGAPLVDNLALVTGTDILSGLGYLGIQGEMYMVTDGDPLADATLNNLGVESNLYFLTLVAGG